MNVDVRSQLVWRLDSEFAKLAVYIVHSICGQSGKFTFPIFDF